MQFIADLHLHSRFSRAVSREMTLPAMANWARQKGIGLLATGDWTHPMWFREIEKDLEETGNGLLKLKATGNGQTAPNPLFLLSTEISCIYSLNGKGRRIHILIWVPSIESARKIIAEMTKCGCNLLSDGRPIIGLSAENVAELVLSIEPSALVIPAHIWTPWFSLYGAMSGFNSIGEAFGPYAKYIYAVETGLSSSPDMNWQIAELDTRSIVSFSDAHSGAKLGRETTVFTLESLSFESVRKALMINGQSLEIRDSRLGKKGKQNILYQELDSEIITQHSRISNLESQNSCCIAYTTEFYPEEGKYHFTGHRACNVRYSPEESHAKGTSCPVCGKPLTQGVMQRVEELAERTTADLRIEFRDLGFGENIRIQSIGSGAYPARPPFVMLVPLAEIISECIGSPVTSPKVEKISGTLLSKFGGEFGVLLHTPKEDIAGAVGEKIAVGIEKVRCGDIVVDPGYDGVFGIVKLWKDGEERALVDTSREQLGLF